MAWAEDKPAPPVSTSSDQPLSRTQIDKLIEQLGDKDYFVRQRAQEALARLGFEAFDAVSAATTHPDLEISSRAKYLLRLMRVEWTAEGDSPAVKRCLRNYEFEDERSRVARMQALAHLADGQGIAALCRLVRFEKSPLLSKTAAVALLASQADADPPSKTIVETVEKALDGCHRPGAEWLKTWTQLGSEPEAAMTQWNKLTADEQNLLQQTPDQTSSEIVAGLTRFQILRLKKLGRNDEAMAAVQRLVELEPGNPETLGELLQWLVEQKAWKAVDDLAGRFAPLFDTEPGLIYLLAEACLEQGQKDRAEELAAKASKLFPGKEQQNLFRHLMAAQSLRDRGHIAWATREFEHLIAQSGDPENDELRVMALSLLSEMLHDQGQDLAAAESLEKIVKDIDSGNVTEAELGGRRANDVRSRMNYFYACHWQNQNDPAKHRESIEKALKTNPEDIDVLIACYRLPDQTPEYRANILQLIEKEASVIRGEIAAEPNDPSPYNQLAWLIGNTEGDLDEALKCSQRSLELKPDEGGFYDTLARVYYARGDLDNAVKFQTKAAELDPHSGLIQRQLELFRNAQEKKKAS